VKELDAMADKKKPKDKGNLRERLIDDYKERREGKERREEPDPEVTKLASELAGSVGKTVAKATDLGLSVVEDVGLKVMEVLSTSKTKPSSGVLGAAATLFTRTRAKVPEVSGQVASKVTDLMVNGGFGVLRVIQQTVRNTRRSG
jgi:hypothetical protein